MSQTTVGAQMQPSVRDTEAYTGQDGDLGGGGIQQINGQNGVEHQNGILETADSHNKYDEDPYIDDEIQPNENDIVIAVMGITGAGKSTFIKHLTGQELVVGHGVVSCTNEVGIWYFQFHGQRVFLIDTPGFDDTNRSDTDTLKDIALWLTNTYSQNVRLAGLVYLHPINQPRLQGGALKNLRMFRKLCGKENLRSVVLATTHWTNSDGTPAVTEVDANRRINDLSNTPEFWGNMVAEGSSIYRHENNPESALRIVSEIIGKNNKVVLDIQKQMVEQHMTLDDTDAGQALLGEILAERLKMEAKIEQLNKDNEEAKRERDDAWQEEIRKEREAYEAKLKEDDAARERLRIDLDELREEKERQYEKLKQEMEEERREAKVREEAREKELQSVMQGLDNTEKQLDEVRKQQSKIEAERIQQQKRAEKAEKRALEDRLTAQQEAAEKQRAHELKMQEAGYRQKELELQAQIDQARVREETARRTLEAEKEARGKAERLRSRMNPKRWFGNRYRPA